jgi:phosphoglucomutase
MSMIDDIRAAGQAGRLLAGSVRNLEAFLAAGLPAWAQESIAELVTRGEWAELNDRFYQDLEFGTGGMRGRTIGRIGAAAETGAPDSFGGPAHAAIGSNMMNDVTLVRATIGLFRHVSGYLRGRGVADRPRIVIAHDVRFFSAHFAELAASAWIRLGGEAFLFAEPRPTPQLSFSVRWLKAHAGVVITASHNPPHDNGYKAYFDDGAQVVPPHDAAIVAEVKAVPLGDLGPFLEKDISRVTVLGREADDAYLAVAAQAALDPTVFRSTRLKVAFTNIHGTGSVHVLPILVHAGCELHEVREQLAFDPRFPTVKSANPENAEALSMAVALAERTGCDVVLATDPDDDRMGCAVRSRTGSMELLTGNQVGALLADYRLMKLKESGLLPAEGSRSACIIKTFVTTGLQDEIARHHGVKVINTLTGFKWIASKIRGYERRLSEAMGPGFSYDETPLDTRARLLLAHSTFFVLGTEESYGYLPNDWLRDKDGNAACLMMAELCAWAKGRGETVPEYLDRLYVRHGYHLEGVINLYYEGASGHSRIRRILDTYRSSPPTAFGETAVSSFQDFGRQRIVDADGEEIPRQDLYLVTLANGYSFAARGSGTEPKMKFYVFGRERVPDAASLPAVKERVKATVESLRRLIEEDARARAGEG